MADAERGFSGLTQAAALRRLRDALSQAGVEAADAEARLLLQGAADVSRADLIRDPDLLLPEDGARRLADFLARRLAHEPATRIVGRRAFWTLDLDVAPGVLDPRPDSETIVEAALAELGARRTEPLRILDLGVGSGALLLALLAECPRATGLGIDLSEDACRLAAANARHNGLAARFAWRQGAWTEGVDQRFDLVLSNPPYIESDVIETLDPEVREHDPRLALDGGADGLDAYRAIVADLPRRLAPGGFAVLELGAGQAPAVASLAERAGLAVRALRSDLGGVERAIVLS